MEIFERLKIFKEKLGLNDTEMGKKFQVSHTMYAKYENGTNRLSIDKLKILGGLGCNLHWLITGEGNYTENKTIDNSNALKVELNNLKEENKKFNEEIIDLKGQIKALERMLDKYCKKEEPKSNSPPGLEEQRLNGTGRR